MSHSLCFQLPCCTASRKTVAVRLAAPILLLFPVLILSLSVNFDSIPVEEEEDYCDEDIADLLA